MKVVILAGGEGTRLRPVTYEIPKPLLPIHGEPLINHIIRFLRRSGEKKIGIIAFQKNQENFSKWKKEWQRSLKISPRLFFEKKRKGTFGCLLDLKKWIGKEDFLVVNGDCIADFDLEKLKKIHKESKNTVTSPLLKVLTSGSYGVTDVTSGKMKKIWKQNTTPVGGYIVGGYYIIRSKIFSEAKKIKNKSFIHLELDIFPPLMNRGEIDVVAMPESYIMDVGTFESWEKAREVIGRRNKKKIDKKIIL